MSRAVDWLEPCGNRPSQCRQDRATARCMRQHMIPWNWPARISPDQPALPCRASGFLWSRGMSSAKAETFALHARHKTRQGYVIEALGPVDVRGIDGSGAMHNSEMKQMKLHRPGVAGRNRALSLPSMSPMGARISGDLAEYPAGLIGWCLHAVPGPASIAGRCAFVLSRGA